VSEAARSDFEVHIRRGGNGALPVSVRVTPEDRRAEGTLRLPLTDAEVDEALGWMEQGLFDAQAVRELGGRLFAALFTGAVRDVYLASRQTGTAPRIRLLVDDPEVARLPWELLHDSDLGSFLARDGPFVRGVALAEPTRPLVVEPPLRLLVAHAFPRGVPRAQHQLETDGIRRALGGLIRRRRIELVTLPSVTLEKLQAALRQAADAGRPFHLLHFIGHGRYDARTGHSELFMERDDGTLDRVDADDLVSVLRAHQLRLVFLNACQSAATSTLEVTRGLAPALLRSGIPAVIGMQVTVLDEVAVAFARHFYAALADNRPVDLALAEARQLARGSTLRRKADMGIPVCYLRTQTGQLFDLASRPTTRLTAGTWRTWLREQLTVRKLWTRTAAAISALVTLLTLYGFVVPRFRAPARMTGDLNIAVAEFGQLDQNGQVVKSKRAVELATSVAEVLQRELGPLRGLGFDIQVRGPTETGPIEGTTRQQRADRARQLAAAINAKLLVYGVVTQAPTRTSISPEFYLADTLVPGAEELVGDHELGSALETLGDPDANLVLRKDLRAKLIARTQALVQLAIGLGYYAADRFDQAADSFTMADRVPGWEARDGKEILYLFLGNTAGRLRRYQEATVQYRKALAVNPEYARAQIGLAEVRFHQASGDGSCARDRVDAAGLADAVVAYQRAKAATDRPALADVDSKIALGLGRTYTCQSQAEVAHHWREAEEQFLRVIEVFRAGNQRIRQLAAEAWAGLGLVHLPPAEAPDKARYRQAAADYQRAIELSTSPARQGTYYGMLGYIHARLGEPQLAHDAYDQAIRLDPENREWYLRERGSTPTSSRP
jgi:tetratricopeptide (TPR) repeat protein